MKSGDLSLARRSLQTAALQTAARESDYLAVVSDLRAVLSAMKDWRAALTVDWYGGARETFTLEPDRYHLVRQGTAVVAAREQAR